MKRVVVLFFVAAITMVALLFFTNPGLLDKVWLWIIGFFGYIIGLVNTGIEKLSSLFKKEGDRKPFPILETGSIPSKDTDKHSPLEEIALLKKRIRMVENQLEEVKKHQIQ